MTCTKTPEHQVYLDRVHCWPRLAVTPVRDEYTKDGPETAVGKTLHRRTAVRLSMFLRLTGGARERFATGVLQELATRI